MRYLRLLLHLSVLFGTASSYSFGQNRGPLTCLPSAVPAIVRSEGLAEQLGNIVLNCSGGYPNDTLSMNLGVFLVQTNITNRLDANGFSDLYITADNGAGPVRVGTSSTVQGSTGLITNGIVFTLNAQGATTITIQNLRGAAAMVGGVGFLPAITAYLSVSTGTPGSIAISNNPVVVGTPRTGLYASQIPAAVACQNGTLLPTGNSFANFISNGARFFSTRVTEGFPDAFKVKGQFDDTGTRFIIRYNGLPTGARVVVPVVIAGSDAATPTRAGDFGGTPSAGAYAPTTNGTLILSLVSGADTNGVGGSVSYSPGAAASSFDALSDLTIDASGNSYAVYEVVQANNFVQESAQIPTFVGIQRTGTAQTISVATPVSFAPVSTVNTIAQNVPEPRFLATTPPNDCSIVGDCNANYLPKLSLIIPEPFNYTVPQGTLLFARYIQIDNGGGGLLTYNVTVTYTNPQLPFVILYPASTIGNSTLRVDFNTLILPPGTYTATITIDAGVAGVQNIPVSIIVVPKPVTPTPAVMSVGNAAQSTVATLVPGSLASVFGQRFAGTKVGVTFDGMTAQTLYANDTQINVMVPAALAGKTTSQVVVTVDGLASAAQTVTLASSAPAIFANGVLNQDNSINTATGAAASSSVLQLFATGLTSPNSSMISVKVNGQTLSSLYYAGDAPGIPGVQQVDFFLPAGLQNTTASIQACGQPTDGSAAACSAPATVTVGQ